MSTKTKIALAAVLVAATSSVAFATEFNRSAAVQRGMHQSVPVRPLRSRDVALPTRGQADSIEIDRNDRASSPYAGGVG